ncbi:hypothetical protein ETD83_30230, partial [Actinomadura soli]
MTQETLPGADGPPSNEPCGALAALVQVREQAIELLARLERPPRNLRIEAGEVTVDIAWAWEDAPPAAAPAPSAPAAIPA